MEAQDIQAILDILRKNGYTVCYEDSDGGTFSQNYIPIRDDVVIRNCIKGA